MGWQYQFALISFLVTTILLIFYSNLRYLPTRHNRYFHLLLFTQAACCLANMASSMAIVNVDRISEQAASGIVLVYFMSYCFMVMLVFHYVKSMCMMDTVRLKPSYLLLYLPMFITMITYLLTPATKFVFYFDEMGNYCYGPGYFIYYMITFVYGAFCIILVGAHRKSIPASQRWCIYWFSLILFVGCIIRYYHPKSMIMNVFTMLGLLALYLVRQNPENFRDAETKLFNVMGFESMLHETFLTKRLFSLICFDIFNYETIRSAYGGDIVNHVKTSISHYLQKEFPDAVPFYLTRGRFVLLYPMGKNPMEDAEKIRERFKMPWDDGKNRDSSINIKAYLNVVPSNIEFSSERAVTDHVSRMIMMADADASSKIYVIDDEHMKRMRRNADIEKEVERVIADNSIEVYYQPIYSTEKGKIISAEALARLHSEKYGFISPDEFIRIAEQSGDIIKLGEQIFEKVCSFMHDNDITQYGLEYVEINLSPIQCRNPLLAGKLMKIAEKYQIPSSQINLEITETATENMELISAQITKLKQNGVSFSMDDYGTGYSNLISILELPFHIIKIDKSIVWAYFGHKNDVLTDLISMFKNRGYYIVCEGVETKEMVDGLTKLGCHYLQGFYFSKAIPGKEFVNYIADFNHKDDNVA